MHDKDKSHMRKEYLSSMSQTRRGHKHDEDIIEMKCQCQKHTFNGKSSWFSMDYDDATV